MFRLPRTPMSLLVGLQISKFTKSGSRSLTKEAVFKWAARLLTRRSATSVAPSFSLFLRSEEHTFELQSHSDLVCRLLLEKKKSGANTTSLTGRLVRAYVRRSTTSVPC